MDIRLQELLDKIRKDGIEAAQTDAAKVLAEAEERRRAVLAEADREAKALLAKAKADADRFEEAGKAALEQAARNLVISFRTEIEAVLAAIVRTDTEKALSGPVLEAAIPAVLAAWKDKGTDDLAVLLPPAELSKLEASFRKKLESELKKGLELRPFPGIKAGFRIAEKGGAAYYDFSADSLAEMISQYLNARLGQIAAAAIRKE
ncbi:MAG TPA: V-type ATP synthase subunit E [Spirochaetia bacterium]|nr:V-type ATP synthase subunit E [Spirochaetales bacterium]HRY79706.1 V-type ATP synthase subunit E [Spirochaetia bacterium]